MKKYSIESIAHFFTIIGVMSAILFAGYQAYYLRKDFNLNMRPYIKIDTAGIARIEHAFLGFVVSREDCVLGFYFEKDKQARLIVPLQITNIGKTPARIEEARVSIKSSKTDKEFFAINFFKDNDKKYKYVIFPNETLDISLDETYTVDKPNGVYYPTVDPKPNFNAYFSEVQNCIKTEDFICQVTLKYDIFTEAKNNKIYTTHKVWIVKPGGKKAFNYYYAIE